MDELKYWEFKIGVEVSTRYHDWRRGTYQSFTRITRAVTFLGAVFTLLTAFNPLNWAPQAVAWSIACLAVVIAVVNLLELVFDFGGSVFRHTDLYRRFMKLQEKMTEQQKSWQSFLAEWEAEAQAIRRDEPPTMWAIYAICWNQTIDRHQLERKGYYRNVGWLRYWFRNFVQFSPQDFPAAA